MLDQISTLWDKVPQQEHLLQLACVLGFLGPSDMFCGLEVSNLTTRAMDSSIIVSC